MYHPTGRVLTLLELLQSRPRWTAGQLADRLECDARTVRRYIGKLLDIGIPVESESGPAGGYGLRPGYRVPPLMFTDNEALAVALGLAATAWLGVSIPEQAAATSLSKVLRVLPQRVRERVGSFAQVFVQPTGVADESALPTLIDLVRASSEGWCVALEYQTQERTSRTVEPYGVAGYQGYWYLVGYCRLRQDLRVFRLDRIVQVRVLGERFDRPAAFELEAYIRSGLENQRWRIRVRFCAGERPVRRLFGELGIFTPTPNGGEYEGPASDLDLVARQLMLSRLEFTVIGPPELREAFRALAAEAQRMALAPE